MSEDQFDNLTREDKQPVDWSFLREMAVLVSGAMFVAGLLTAVGMLVLDATLRIESSVAVVEIHAADDQDLTEMQSRQVLYDMVDPKRLDPMVRQIQNVNPAWVGQFPDIEAAVDDLRSRLLVAGQPGSDEVHLQLSGRLPMNVQAFLEILVMDIQRKPVLEDPTVKVETAAMPGVRVDMLRSPSEPVLVFPRLIPIGVIMFIIFMPIFPGAMVLMRRMRGRDQAT